MQGSRIIPFFSKVLLYHSACCALSSNVFDEMGDFISKNTSGKSLSALVYGSSSKHKNMRVCEFKKLVDKSD